MPYDDHQKGEGAPPPAAGTGMILRRLHSQCTQAIENSLQGQRAARLGETYLFTSDLEAWSAAIHENREAQLISTAANEYVLATLNLCQGQYRNGFKGLRLVLELCLQSTHLSTNLVLQAEWLKGEADTVWATLVDHENGPLSIRSSRAFFPDLVDHVAHFRQLAKTLYRELSECIHGNVPNYIPLPASLDFSEDTFELWQAKARSVRLVVNFSFTLRYLLLMPKEKRAHLEAVVTQELGHIPAVRAAFE